MRRQPLSASASVRVWDFFVIALVFFPLLSGGIWIQRPHLFLELADVGLSVAIVGILALILKVFFLSPLEESWTLGVVISLWQAWRRALEKDPVTGLISGTLGVGLLWSVSSVLRHMSLNSHAFDLGIFSNAVWHLVHGDGPWSSVKGGISLFADHESPILAGLAPFFFIFPDPKTLLIAQGFGLAAGAIPLFWLGRQYLAEKDPWLAALPLFYWAWLPLRNANAFDFHPEVFMLPLFLAAIAGLQSGKRSARMGGALAFLLALSAKESAGAVACGIGLGWCLGAGPLATRGFTRRLGFVAAALGLGVFVLDVKVVPGFFGAQYAYQNLYSQYGGGVSQLPLLFLSQLFGPARLKFLFWTLAPLGFLPLLNPRALVAALPGYLMLFLSAGDHRVNLGYHYAIEPGVGLFWALPGALAVFSQWRGQTAPGSRRAVFATIAIVFLAASTFGRSEINRIRRNFPSARSHWITSRFLACVSPTLSIAASEALVPHLASRPWVHTLESILDSNAKPVDCVIEDRSIGNAPMSAQDFEHLSADLARFGYRPIYSNGTLEAYGQPGARCIWCLPEGP